MLLRTAWMLRICVNFLVQQAFNLTANDLQHVDDVMATIASHLKENYQTAIQNISSAVSISGTMAQQAGLSFEQFAAIIGTVTEKTRLSGETVAQSLKMIMARVGQVKSAVDELNVTNQDISNSSKAMAAIGVDTLDRVTGQLRPMGDILADVASKWDTLSSTQKANLAFAAAGQRQYSTFEALIMSYSKSQDLAAQATNSSGTALKAQAVYLESTEAKIKSFQSTLATMWQNAISSDFLGGLVQIGTYLVSNIVPTLVLITGLIVALNGKAMVSGLITAWQGVSTTFVNMGKSIGGLFTNMDTDAQTSALAVTKLADAQSILKTKQEAVTVASNEYITAQKAATVVQDTNTVATEGSTTSKSLNAVATEKETLLTNAQKEAQVAAVVVTDAQTAANTALSASVGGILGIVGLLVTVFSIASMVISGVNQANEAAIQKAVDAATAYTSEKDSLSSLTTQYAELASKTILTADDKTTLKSIQESLITTFGDEAKALDLVNGSYETQIGLIEQLSQKQATDTMRSLSGKINGARNAISQTGTSYETISSSNTPSPLLNDVSGYTSTDNGQDIQINGTLAQRVAVLGQILDNANKITNQTKEESTATKAVQTEYDALNKTLSASKTIVDSFNLAQLSANKTTSSAMGQLTKDVQDYQNAMQSGDKGAAVKTASDFKAVTDSIDKALAKNPELKALFDNWVNGLNLTSNATNTATTSTNNLTASVGTLSQNLAVDAFTSTVTALTDLNGALVKVKAGYSFSSDEISALVEKYPSLIDSITKTSTGYTIQKSALIDLINTTQSGATAQIDNDIATANATIQSCLKAVEAYGIQEDAINSLTLATSKLAEMQIEQGKIAASQGGYAASSLNNGIGNLQNLVDAYKNVSDLTNQENKLKDLLSTVGNAAAETSLQKAADAAAKTAATGLSEIDKARIATLNTQKDILTAQTNELDKQKQVIQDQLDLLKQQFAIQNNASSRQDLVDAQTAAQTALTNTQNEKDVKLLVGDQWVSVADPATVATATKTLTDAQKALSDFDTKASQQAAEDALQAKMDAIDVQKQTISNSSSAISDQINAINNGTDTGGSSPAPASSGSLNAGQRVHVSGKWTGNDAGGGGSGTAKSGAEYKIDRVVSGVKNPYLVETPSGTVQGWVNASQLQAYHTGGVVGDGSSTGAQRAIMALNGEGILSLNGMNNLSKLVKPNTTNNNNNGQSIVINIAKIVTPDPQDLCSQLNGILKGSQGKSSFGT